MNPIAISFGNIEIRWYAILILSGFLIGMYLIKKESLRKKLDTNIILDLCFYLVIVSILGARVYYVIFEFDQYKNNLIEIFKIWNGGLAIHGGIIAGIIFTYFYSKKHKINILQITDIIAPALILGQAIGRWGNFFNSEAHGIATSLAKLESLHIPNFIIKGMNINGVYYHPTFLYESIWCFIGFIVLLILRRNKYLKVGSITGVYLMWYSIGRFFIEHLRTDSLMLGGFRVAQIISIILFAIGLTLIIRNKKQTKFENLYNSDKDNKIRF